MTHVYLARSADNVSFKEKFNVDHCWYRNFSLAMRIMYIFSERLQNYRLKVNHYRLSF